MISKLFNTFKHYRNGVSHFQRGEMELAEKEFEELLKLSNSGHELNYMYLAEIKAALGKYEESISFAKKIVDDPIFHAYKERLLEILAYDYSELNDCASTLETILKMDKRTEHIIYKTAQCYLALGMHEEFKSFLKETPIGKQYLEEISQDIMETKETSDAEDLALHLHQIYSRRNAEPS